MDHAIQPAPPSGANPAPAPPPEGDLTGRLLGEFQVLRRLGQGGMGQVYVAEQVSLKRKVALKILKAELAADPVSLQRFRAEAEAIARITHANIVQVYAIGEAGGLNYMALEYVEGCNLRDYLVRKGPPDVPLALSVMRQVAAALQRAGEAAVVHRDIKPENILLTRKGEVKVADFGLSRILAGREQPLNLTQTGTTMGTPLYMSPEQVQGQPTDTRSDIYSFGVTCYHMLAGDPPFRGTTAFEVALQHVQAKPRPLGEVRPDLPADLCRLVDRMLAKKPEDRFASAGNLLKELSHLRESLGSSARNPAISTGSFTPPEAPPDPRPTVALPAAGGRRLRRVAALTVVAALVGGAAVGWYRGGSNAAAVAPEPTGGPVDDVKRFRSAQEHEQFLLRAVEEFARPDTPGETTAGLEHAVKLGLLYLDQWRLDDADRFFDHLTNIRPPVKSYRTFGRLGHAIVLAFRDRPKESNQAFLSVVVDWRQPDSRLRFLLSEPRLRQTVAKALSYNAANNAADPEPIPPALQFLRRPPIPLRPGADRPLEKGRKQGA